MAIAEDVVNHIFNDDVNYSELIVGRNEANREGGYYNITQGVKYDSGNPP